MRSYGHRTRTQEWGQEAPNGHATTRKGSVWVNGHNLGRYWGIGPRQALFVPSAWLKKGRSEVVVLDLEGGRRRSVAGVKDLTFETLGS